MILRQGYFAFSEKRRPQILYFLMPGQYLVKEEYIHPGMGRILVSETKVVYKDYRFFIVETEVEIKEGHVS